MTDEPPRHALQRAVSRVSLRAVHLEDTITIRVRYAETDRMGLLHHAQYLVYFEQGRVELLRKRGFSYRELEDEGYLMVLKSIEVQYRSPARFDDELQLTTSIARATGVRIEHAYALRRADELLAEARTTLVCVNREGHPQRLHPRLINADYA